MLNKGKHKNEGPQNCAAHEVSIINFIDAIGILLAGLVEIGQDCLFKSRYLVAIALDKNKMLC